MSRRSQGQAEFLVLTEDQNKIAKSGNDLCGYSYLEASLKARALTIPDAVSILLQRPTGTTEASFTSLRRGSPAMEKLWQTEEDLVGSPSTTTLLRLKLKELAGLRNWLPRRENAGTSYPSSTGRRSAFQPCSPTSGTKHTGAARSQSKSSPRRVQRSRIWPSMLPTGTTRRPPSAS